MNRQRGTVKWFSREKGWGFIRLENGDEIFVHHSDIVGDGFVTLEDDEPVEFTVEEMEKGPRARDVRRSDEAPAGESAVGAAGTARASSGTSSDRTERTGSGGRGRGPEGRDAGANRDSGEGAASGGLRPLAAQLRERLGRHFPGFGG